MHALTQYAIVAAVMAMGVAQTVAAQDDTRFYDVLDMHGAPRDPTDRSFNIFFDAGAWHGYSLPPADDRATGFIGPFVHSLGDGQWVGKHFAELVLRDAVTHHEIALVPGESHAVPGYLVRRFSFPSLKVSQIFFFANSWHALARITLTSSKTQDIELGVEGRLFTSPLTQLAVNGDAVVQTFAHSPSTLTTVLRGEGLGSSHATLSASGYRLDLDRPLHLTANQTVTVYVDQSLVYDPRAEAPASVDDATAWSRNRQRWAGYLQAIPRSHLVGVSDETAERVALKAMITLLGNWRAARGDLLHDGVIPAYSNPDFNGFWAWDSWKHAAALATFAPDLARDQIRATFDYQAADGMVPDCIYLHRADDNWRDSKPPLATWATLAVYRATGDKAFLGEMYDKLVRYHQWWFAKRDHAHDGLAEFGSTDGTAIAAKWESGMDNAVRFDRIRMLKNGEGAWSMDQESVDLNAYLYREKLDLAEIAQVLGKTNDHARWLQEAAAMKTLIQARLFDPARGYFFDRKLDDGAFVRVYGSEGWAPLWAGAASVEQAKAVVQVMTDPHKFATYLPFPTLARDDAHFSPIKGYWRGPVWLDQAYFGIEALRNYGYTEQADALARDLLFHAKGLTEQAPTYENYDPLTGPGYQSRNFSWAAASYWLLLQDAGAVQK
jgi:putative isomerase